MIRAYLSLIYRVMFGKLDTDLSQSLAFARMYGELTTKYVTERDENNAYVLACRAFHHASRYLETP